MKVHNYYSSLVLSLGLVGFVTSTATIAGTLSNVHTGEPIVFATLILYKNDRALSAVATDVEGRFVFDEITTGVYDLEVKQVGYLPLKRQNVYVAEGESKKIVLQLTSSQMKTDEVVSKPMIDNEVKPKGRLLKKLGLLLDKLIDRKLKEI